MRWWMVGLLVGLSYRVTAQVIVPPLEGQDNAVTTEKVFATPPAFKLIPHGPQGRTGDVWVRSSPDGLQVFGKVIADKAGFRMPRQRSEMLGSDHVEIWLAAEPDVPMPKIGWGNQFGETDLAGLQDCASQNDNAGDAVQGKADCERWYTEQGVYRAGLKKLFVRQWLMAMRPSGSPAKFEDYASTAYAGLRTGFFKEDLPGALEPKLDDGVTAEFQGVYRQEEKQDAAGHAYQQGHQTGYWFHVMIPYGAFPPARQMALKDLRLMVDVFAAAPEGKKMGEWSTTSAARVWGQPATFNRVALTTPRKFVASPCEQATTQTDLYGATFPGWFLPSTDGVLKSTFALINPAAGYMYEPGGISPEVKAKEYFWRDLPGGATVCGPELTWKKSAAIKRTKEIVVDKYVETKPLADGWSLVKFGPTTATHSPFGSGQCGSCLVMGLDVYAVSPAGEITTALSLQQDMSGEHNGPDATDLAITAGWARITLFEQFENLEEKKPETHWESESYCLAGHVYKPCGSRKNATPPNPANYQELGSDR